MKIQYITGPKIKFYLFAIADRPTLFPATELFFFDFPEHFFFSPFVLSVRFVTRWSCSGRLVSMYGYSSVVGARATENRFFAGSDRFIVCKTDSICIKRIFFGPKKTHFADHILAQFPGLVKCQTVNCPQLFQLSMLSTHYWIVKNEISQ